MKEKISVSVVIPMHNAKHTISECLLALDQQNKRPDEVIIVDNNSKDGSYEIVKQGSKSYTNLNIILSTQIKQGPAAARNTGISLASGKIIAFIDSDCIPNKDWIRNIKKIFHEDEDLDAVGGIECGFYPINSISGKLLTVFWLPPADRLQQCIIRRKEDFFSAKLVATFNSAFRKETLLRVNGFDEKFFPAGEDADLWLRALEQNAKIVAWSPKLIVGHKQNIPLIALIKKMFNYGRAMAHLSRRHFSNKIIIKNILGINYECNHFKFTLIIYSNIIKILFLCFGLILMLNFSLLMTNVIIGFVLIYFFIKIRILFKVKKYELSFFENSIILVYYLIKKVSEIAGLIYGGLRYGVLCL